MSWPVRVVHYLNQFFGGIGGEEAARSEPVLMEGPRGPGNLFEEIAPDFHVVATVIAGDDRVAGDPETATAAAVALVAEHFGEGHEVDLVIAGPAFNAGRYGMACGAMAGALARELGVPAICAMSPENPAADEFRGQLPVVATSDDVLGMRDAMEALAGVARKIKAGERLDPAADGLLPTGVRENRDRGDSGARRALEMLLRKLQGLPFETEYPMPRFDRVAPAPPVEALERATVALVTSGGIVPSGNPDRIESASASRFGAYSLEGLDRLEPGAFQSVHGGYDPTYANADPNRVLPLDAMRELEREGRIGKLHPTYYATVGNSTSVKAAMRYGREIAALLVNEGVQAVVLTST